jgi:dihydroneopterin triphosphate diphosphatase
MNVSSNMVTIFVVRPTADATSHEFLQLHRVPDDYMGDTWQLIRGGLNENENAVAGALRELREESGLTPQEFYRLGTVESFYTAIDDTLWHSVAFCALIARDAQLALNEEHDAYRWTPRDKFPQVCMWASERNLLDELLREILDDGPAKPHLRISL